MILLAALLALTRIASSYNDGSQYTCGQQAVGNRIMFGTEARSKEFPWTVALKYRLTNGNTLDFLCAGALINPKFVVTAAHCLTRKSEAEIYSVVIGMKETLKYLHCQELNCVTNAISVQIESVFIHPQYIPPANNNDVGLIRLKRSVPYNEFIRPICLPTSEIAREAQRPGNRLYIAGWGCTESNSQSLTKLLADVPVVPYAQCSAIYSNLGVHIQAESEICAGGLKKDMCRGDSGGALMYNKDGTWYIVGVISYGYKRFGTQGIPSVYMNFHHFMPWFSSIINNWNF